MHTYMHVPARYLPFGPQDHIYDNMVLDEAEVRVVLPEGVTDIAFVLPFSADVSNDVRVAVRPFVL